MKAVSVITGVLESMKSDGLIDSVIYHTPSRVNVDLAGAKYPCAVLSVITDRVVDPYKQTAREHAKIAGLFFLVRQPQLAFSGMQNEGLVEDMTMLGYEFIDRLRDDSSVRIAGDVNMLTVLNHDDTNTTGVCLQFDLLESQGVCIAIEEQWWLFDNGKMIRFDNDRRVAVR